MKIISYILKQNIQSQVWVGVGKICGAFYSKKLHFLVSVSRYCPNSLEQAITSLAIAGAIKGNSTKNIYWELGIESL